MLLAKPSLWNRSTAISSYYMTSSDSPFTIPCEKFSSPNVLMKTTPTHLVRHFTYDRTREIFTLCTICSDSLCTTPCKDYNLDFTFQISNVWYWLCYPVQRVILFCIYCYSEPCKLLTGLWIVQSDLHRIWIKSNWCQICTITNDLVFYGCRCNSPFSNFLVSYQCTHEHTFSYFSIHLLYLKSCKNYLWHVWEVFSNCNMYFIFLRTRIFLRYFLLIINPSPTSLFIPLCGPARAFEARYFRAPWKMGQGW